MADLRELLTTLGCSSVATLLNSGNAVVSPPRVKPSSFSQRLSKALEEKFGWQIPVVVKTAEMFRTIADKNPFAADCSDDSKLLIAFAESSELLDSLVPVSAAVSKTERFALTEHAAYLMCSGPLLESPAAKEILSRSGRAITTRNWATVQKIRSVLEQPEFQ
jgi:uncharacterized protein (DUF1697 family)